MNDFGTDYRDLIEYSRDSVVTESEDNDFQVVQYPGLQSLLTENTTWRATEACLFAAASTIQNPDKSWEMTAAAERLSDQLGGYDYPIVIQTKAGSVLLNPKIHGGEIKIFAEQMSDADEAIASDNEILTVGFGPHW